MVLALGSLLSMIFVVLSAIHFYWAFGGKWGVDASLPSNGDGIRVLKPSAAASMIVGIGLSFFALFYLVKVGILSGNVPSWSLRYGGWILPLIFLLRAIGDFKYVGLFKKVNATKFAQADTKYFIPLCAFLAVAGLIVQMNS